MNPNETPPAGQWAAQPPDGSGMKAVFLPDPPKGSRKGQQTYKNWAQDCIIAMVEYGYPQAHAAREVGHKYDTLKSWAHRDPEFAERLKDAVKVTPREAHTYPNMKEMSFPQFVKRYFGPELAKHQIEITNALEDPDAQTVMVLGFPEAGKSTLVGLWYALYRMCQNFNIRILIVVATDHLAKRMLSRIKDYLTKTHLYEGMEGNLVEDFGGFQPAAREGTYWRENMITIRQKTSGERDATIQTIGLDGAIYGVRQDLIIFDDALNYTNQHTEERREKIHNWFWGEIRSRAQKGQIVINGTRLREDDLYGRWMDEWSDWPTVKIVRIPAVLREGTEHEESHWPEMFSMEDKYIWDENRQMNVLEVGWKTRRAELMRLNPRRWRIVYQQEDLRETEAVFREDPHYQVALAMGSNFEVGEVLPGEKLILGVDPATRGRAASVLIAFNPDSRVRRCVDMYTAENIGADGIREKLLYQFWDKYAKHGIDITAVEINWWPMIRGDRGIEARARQHGTRIVEHQTLGSHVTGRRGVILDEDFGVHSLAPKMAAGLIAFPSKRAQDKRFWDMLWFDMENFPFKDPVGDSLVALWIADSAVHDRGNRRIDQVRAQRNMLVPPKLLQEQKAAELRMWELKNTTSLRKVIDDHMTRSMT